MKFTYIPKLLQLRVGKWNLSDQCLGFSDFIKKTKVKALQTPL